jgi:hypothetical protein
LRCSGNRPDRAVRPGRQLCVTASKLS